MFKYKVKIKCSILILESNLPVAPPQEVNQHAHPINPVESSDIQ